MGLTRPPVPKPLEFGFLMRPERLGTRVAQSFFRDPAPERIGTYAQRLGGSSPIAVKKCQGAPGKLFADFVHGSYIIGVAWQKQANERQCHG